MLPIRGDYVCLRWEASLEGFDVKLISELKPQRGQRQRRRQMKVNIWEIVIIIGEVWNPVCCHGNQIIKPKLWSTFSRILLQRIKLF